ncbi:MAG: hypothetical protein JNG90_09445 [Planctomycetaceae bacterium]|nr:hypothetical protein [Planctomycetaceae bacterium]
MNALKPWLLIVALGMVSVAPTRGTDGICARCGCHACLQKVCVPKLTEREITKVCWDYKCEDVCIPGPSVKCGVQCQQDDCGCWSHEIWKPTCACVKTRRVPVKTEVKRKVPSVEWKVEYRCVACCQSGCGLAPSGSAPSGAVPLPAPPRYPDPAPLPPVQR